MDKKINIFLTAASLKRFAGLKKASLFAVLMLVFGQVQAVVVVNETISVTGTYTAPSNGQVTITITGADGGNENSGTNGGEGATVAGIFDVTAGQVIGYIVGQAGTDGTNNSAGGGGSTGVYIDSTLVLVAGAGGGGDNSTGAVGLGGNTVQDGDSGTGTGPGAGGTGGNGGGAGGGGNDSGGGGGVISDGVDGIPNSGGAQATGAITFASGGTGASGSNGGQGLTGGGGANGFYSGGGGGYSGGGGAGANGSAGGGGSYINTGSSGYVSGSATAGGDGAGTESDGSIVVDFTPSATLAIDKTASATTVSAGAQVNYTIVVQNTGTAAATDVTVSDTLPTGFSFVSTDSGSCGTGPTPGATGNISWGTCTIAASGFLTLDYTVNVAAGTVGGVYTNSASVTSNETSSGPDTVDVTVLDADLAITKSVDNAYPNEGDNILYTLTATNNGGGDATGVTVTDTLPSGTTYDSFNFVTGSGSCSHASQVVTCNVTGTIANSGAVQIEITATVNTGLGDSAVLTNTAGVSADQNDPESGNDSDTAVATICPADHLHNIASVSSGVSDPDAANNSGHICTEVANRDFGDAPASYGDASHRIPGTPTIYLGSVIPDAELTSQSNANADGDDADGNDDEDGVTFRSPAGTSQSIFADVVVVTGGATVTVCGWLDIAVDPVEPPEFTEADLAEGGCLTTADPFLTFQWSNLPQDQSYITYARFRVCSTPAECIVPTGSASNGEVEDYRVQFDFTPTAVTIGEVSLVAESIEGFLSGFGEDGGIEAMLAMLVGFDPALADALADASTAEIRAALIDYLDPDGDGHVAILRWQTLQERGTVGFYVERRQGDIGDWERINGGMLPGLIAAPLGGEYLLADPEALSGETYQYQLVELEAWGTRRTYGPWTLSLPR